MLHAQIYLNFDSTDRQLRICTAVINISLILILSCLSLQLAGHVRATIASQLGVEVACLWTTKLTMKGLLEGKRNWLALQGAFRPLAMLSITYTQVYPGPIFP